MRILAIETSCDETAIAVLSIEDGIFTLEKNLVSSQISTHAQYGGVVPEIAARMHTESLPLLLKEALDGPRPDYCAVTAGPGLITSLTTGVNAARALSYSLGIPLVPVNHIEGHVASNLLEGNAIEYPALALIVSGGHTELISIPEPGHYIIIGKTRDDAVGEAFDKVAKILGLPYPGGPAVSKCAEMGDAKSISLPRPMIESNDCDFSFSGLKTAVRYLSEEERSRVDDVCASFQDACVDVLVSKTLRALRTTGARTLLFGGGVTANRALRSAFTETMSRDFPMIPFYFPSLSYCTDNAAMIAAAAYGIITRGAIPPASSWKPNPQWHIDEPLV